MTAVALGSIGWPDVVTSGGQLQPNGLRTILSHNNFWNQSPSGNIVKTHRKRPVSPLATFVPLLKGGVHDPRFAGPFYIEDWPLILCDLEPNGSGS